MRARMILVTIRSPIAAAPGHGDTAWHSLSRIQVAQMVCASHDLEVHVRKSLSAIALLAAGSLALTGCGSNSSSSGGSSSGTNAAPPLSDLNIHARSDLKQGGNLRLSVETLPTDWNAYSVDGNGGDNSTIWSFTGVNNFIYNEDASFKPDTDFLTSYDVKAPTGGKGQVVTLHLNPKAKWNSGRQIDYTDYVATWNANNGVNTKFTPASTDGWDQIDSVEKGASNTDVVVTFKKAYPDWSSTLGSVMPKEGVSDPNTYNTGWATFNPNWHTGPFTFASLDKAQKVLTIKRNPAWWGDPAMLDQISFRELQNPADVNAYANNEIDVVGPMINANSVNTAKKRTDGVIRTAGALQWRHFTMNSKSAVMSDVAVRQAIQRGTNREAIAGSDLAGLPLDPASVMLGNHFFMPGQQGYKDNSGDFSYSVDAAKKLLDDDGWKMPSNGKFRTKNGKELDINYTQLSGVATSTNEGKLFQNDMAQIGVKVNIVSIAPNDMNKVLQAHSFDIIAFTWVGTNYPMGNIRQIYGAQKEGSTVPSGSNYAQLVNPDIEKLIPQVAQETDVTKREDLANQIDKLIWQEGHTLPLYRRIGYVAEPKNLANYGSSTFQTTRVEDIGYTK